MSSPNTIIITVATARKYFPEIPDLQNLIGKTLLQNDGSEMNISGIVAGFPVQTHLEFDFLASLQKF